MGTTWRARGRFLSQGLAGLFLPVVVVLVALGSNSPLYVLQYATSAGYTTNNVHDLLLTALRRGLGEDPDLIAVPTGFQGWWVATTRPTELRSAPESTAPVMDQVDPGAHFYVLAPQETDWVRVYAPTRGQRGYLPGKVVVETEGPAAATDDPVLAHLVGGPAASPILDQAATLLRLVTWSTFSLIWMLVAWQATSRWRLWLGSAIVLLAWYWLLSAWFWPWYVVWALALAALVPTSRPAGLAVLLSATVFFLYVSNGYLGSPQTWIYTYRSLPALVLPLAVFGLVLLSGLARGRVGSLASQPSKGLDETK